MPNFLINVKEKGAKKATKNIGGLNSALGGLAGKAALAAGGFFGAGMLLSGMKNAIDLAGKQELAEKKLEASLGHTSTALLEQARALQQVTTFGDEAIIEAQALIAAFVDDEEAVKAATAATLDLAAAKGMDLTAAADLVSKTLGSSTNALSRYGIQVEGAVGSTDRLNSLTGNLADVFGGQASAQAETMSGKIAQMKNALGDAAEAFGELLFPLVIPLAEGLKAIGESAVSVIEAFRSLQDGTLMASETTEVMVRKASDSADSLYDMEQAMVGVKGAMKEMFPESKSFNDALRMAREEGGTVFTEFQKLQVIYTDLKGRIHETKIGLEEGTVEWANYQAAINPASITMLDFNKENANYLENLKKIEPVQITAMSNMERFTSGIKSNKDVLKSQGKQFVSNMQTIGKAYPKAEKAAKRTAQVQALVDAYASANAAYKAMAGIPVIGPGLGIAASAAAVGAGLANVKMIEQAKHGADFITAGPQLMMVGEGSGPERVQVTPLVDENRNGPQGGAINISISGNVMSQDFVEGELSEQIKEAVRRGTDFGLS
tara:strand:+ start:5904 stop:7550 length:1647 start_codon:yes stop_codon:yes gene_type:complete